MLEVAPSEPAIPADTIGKFAGDLRELRRNSGDPTLAALSARTNISKSVISDALTGRRLPSERTVAKLADSLGSDRAIWVERRRKLDPKATRHDAAHVIARDEHSAHPSERRPAPRFSVLHLLLTAASAAVIAVVITSILFLTQERAAPPAAAETTEYVAAAHGVDPRLTKCREDSVIAASIPALDNQAQVQVLYSSECMAAWGRVTRYDGASLSNTLSMRIYPVNDPDGVRTQERTADDLQSLYTPMLVEPDVEARVCAVAEITVDGRVEMTEPLCI